MRVIAGSAKGRRLVVPAGAATRPATDRLRESIFGTLGDRCIDATVLDLFAGSGALGIEALSRGGMHATFVERDAAAIAALRRNAETSGFGDRSTIARGDVASYLRLATGSFDLVFCDPPYADAELLAILLAGPHLRRVTRGLLVVRSLRKHLAAIPEQWTAEREKDVGEDRVRYLS